MAASPGDLPLVIIAGPTASGKSALAMALADMTPCVIVNADASQVYRDLRIVTARPTEDDEARHPHRLFGTIDAAEACSAARWASDARLAIAQAHADGRTPILVGGTGLYIRTLLDGIAPIPEIDPAIRQAVRAMPLTKAYAALVREDPSAATRLSANDTTRVARALEVVRSTGQPIAAWQRKPSGGIREAVRLVPIVLSPGREWLAEQIGERFDAIFELGLDEVRALIARDLDVSLPAMRAIGVREIAAFMAGDASRSAAIESAKLATRQYAKRQVTWFKKQVAADWPVLGKQLTTDSLLDQAFILREKLLTH